MQSVVAKVPDKARMNKIRRTPFSGKSSFNGNGQQKPLSGQMLLAFQSRLLGESLCLRMLSRPLYKLRNEAASTPFHGLVVLPPPSRTLNSRLLTLRAVKIQAEDIASHHRPLLTRSELADPCETAFPLLRSDELWAHQYDLLGPEHPLQLVLRLPKDLSQVSSGAGD